MDRAYIDSHNLIDEYARGKLSGNALEEFEIYMLEHPEIVDDIEFAKGMQDALDESKDRLSADSVDAAAADRIGGFWFGRRYAVAATALLAVSAIFSASFYLQNADLREEIGVLRRPRAITDQLDLHQTRSATDSAAYFVFERKGALPTIIRAEVGIEKSESYSVEITSERLSYSWSESGLVADTQDRIAIFMPAAPTGRYSLRILTEPDQVESMEYEFALVDRIE